MFQGHLPILIELFELGAAVLEPDFHLDRGRDKQVVSLTGYLKEPLFPREPSLQKAKQAVVPRALTPKPASFFPVGKELCGLEDTTGPVCHFQSATLGRLLNLSGLTFLSLQNGDHAHTTTYLKGLI